MKSLRPLSATIFSMATRISGSAHAGSAEAFAVLRVFEHVRVGAVGWLRTAIAMAS